ncbi:MAG: teichoic acid biosynthesis protein, partial [Deltaproteobacteria bacterium]|nr:teichoic acid biosynthesis protein [Deltaproteobacteria bacterium]
LNSLYLEKLGYGEYHDGITAQNVTAFAGRCGGYADSLAAHEQDGNTKILASLDELLERAVEEGPP